jgi:hypothetical protein
VIKKNKKKSLTGGGGGVRTTGMIQLFCRDSVGERYATEFFFRSLK